MMRGFRKPYKKLFNGDTFTTVRPYKYGEEDLVVGREDGIVLFPRTKKALSLGRAVIVGMETIALCDFERLYPEAFAEYDAEIPMENLVEHLRRYCKPETPIVQVFTYLWIFRTIVCQMLYGGNQHLAERDSWVQTAREDQQRLRGLGMEL